MKADAPDGSPEDGSTAPAKRRRSRRRRRRKRKAIMQSWERQIRRPWYSRELGCVGTTGVYMGLLALLLTLYAAVVSVVGVVGVAWTEAGLALLGVLYLALLGRIQIAAMRWRRAPFFALPSGETATSARAKPAEGFAVGTVIAVEHQQLPAVRWEEHWSGDVVERTLQTQRFAIRDGDHVWLVDKRYVEVLAASGSGEMTVGTIVFYAPIEAYQDIAMPGWVAPHKAESYRKQRRARRVATSADRPFQIIVPTAEALGVISESRSHYSDESRSRSSDRSRGCISGAPRRARSSGQSRGRISGEPRRARIAVDAPADEVSLYDAEAEAELDEAEAEAEALEEARALASNMRDRKGL